MTSWAEDVCRIPQTFKQGDVTVRALFEATAADRIHDRDAFVSAVIARLEQSPDLIDIWLRYCQDKRGSGGPYFIADAGSIEVGRLTQDGSHQEIDQYSSPVDACADFIYREAVWVIQRK